jgi:hypothetical protein
MRIACVGSLVLIACLTAVTPLVAQQGTAAIAGRITDEQGAVLPGVAVVATNEETGVFRETTTSTEGTFNLPQLVPGRYKVTARLTGFRNMDRSGLILQVGTTLTVNLALAIGGLEETVTVAGESPLVDTTSARVGGNIGTAELAELPAMNRNYFSAVALLPGVQFTPSNQMGNDTIVSAGQSPQGNNVTVDGGYNIDDALGATAGAQVRTPIEAIQEFQVMTSMYDAESAGQRRRQCREQGGDQPVQGCRVPEASNALTSRPSQSSALGKAGGDKADWGSWWPEIQNKAHFVSLERQIDNPSRTRVYQTRPILFSNRGAQRLNTLIR